MRRIDFLIQKIRKDTNNTNPNRYNDLDIGVYMTNAQKAIQAEIINVNSRNDIFSEELIIPTVPNQEEYDLPADIFAASAINHVDFRSQTQSALYANWMPMPALTNPERNRGWGYVIRNNKLLITPIPQQMIIQAIRLIYVRRLYEIGPRYGKILLIEPEFGGVPPKLTIEMSLKDRTVNITDYFDFFSVVDANGVFKSKELPIQPVDFAINSPIAGQAVILLQTDAQLTGLSVGDFVIGGSRTTSHSELPDVCEQLLTNVSEKFIQYVDSSKDINNANALTTEERNMITELFKSHSPDPPYPPIMFGDYLNL